MFYDGEMLTLSKVFIFVLNTWSGLLLHDVQHHCSAWQSACGSAVVLL